MQITNFVLDFINVEIGLELTWTNWVLFGLLMVEWVKSVSYRFPMTGTIVT